MWRSSHIRLVGTTAAPVWIIWWWLLCDVSKTAAHKPRTRVCDRKDMPTVVLAKDKGTGIFSILQRYAPGEQVPPLNEWTWDANVRHLVGSNYDHIPPRSTKGQPGGLRSRQPNDQYQGHQFISSSSSPSVLARFDHGDDRLLEVLRSPNNTMSDILENADLFYAR